MTEQLIQHAAAIQKGVKVIRREKGAELDNKTRKGKMRGNYRTTQYPEVTKFMTRYS